MSEALAIPEVIPVREEAAAPVRSRFDSIDLLRGLVMVVMALDHTRGYFSDVRTYGPDNLYQASLALFLTRWITHFCAPTFVFLAGTGAFIYGSRVRSKFELAWFLVSRGLWLVILELTLVHWAWSFKFDFLENNGAAVIWAIGWSMVALSMLIFLPAWLIGLFGLVMIVGHNMFDSVQPYDWGSWGWLWRILHAGGGLKPIGPIHVGGLTLGPLNFGVGYPLIPWIGVMAAGYAFGQLFLLERPVRRRWFVIIGLTLTLAFVALRANNDYGDARKWSRPTETEQNREKEQAAFHGFPKPQRQMSDAEFSFCSCLNCTKYPPSLLYLLMTLGPAIFALALFEYDLGPVGRFFVVFGRVPLFFYLLHLPLIHGLMVLCEWVRYGQSYWGVDPKDLPPGYGYSLPVVYLVWIGVVLILYPPCRWYADFKRRHRSAWLSYL
jgi:uncharacterized membrane protein